MNRSTKTDAEDLEITPTKEPSCEGIRDLIVKFLESHSLVTGVAPIREPRGEHL
ncbi:hypothetical protein [Streptomyces anulatus]|uniref:hypothetical protein n=1 Tax=Streptomyces anulatus TaxID=1892 RepID=UPI001D190BD2|nr:hypothetical protein [Streptomyces anulatus]